MHSLVNFAECLVYLTVPLQNIKSRYKFQLYKHDTRHIMFLLIFICQKIQYIFCQLVKNVESWLVFSNWNFNRHKGLEISCSWTRNWLFLIYIGFWWNSIYCDFSTLLLWILFWNFSTHCLDVHDCSLLSSLIGRNKIENKNDCWNQKSWPNELTDVQSCNLKICFCIEY